MENVKVTIANPDGNFAVYVETSSAVTEHERYETQEDAVAALTALLGADKGTYTVVDRQAKSEVYRVAWLGQEAQFDAPTPVPSAKTGTQPADK